MRMKVGGGGSAAGQPVSIGTRFSSKRRKSAMNRAAVTPSTSAREAPAAPAHPVSESASTFQL
jgi:hypothetical protein